jgi:hypothetical protein
VRGIEKPPGPACLWQEYAFRRLTEANPFPSVMGRVCPAPCESGCNRNQVEDFVGINSVEHFLGDYAIKNLLAFPKPTVQTGKTVAVIGGGPAGLSTAYQLALKGHDVTIFDERAELGGMMRYGIPGFRTPRDMLDAEIQRILDLGVKTRLNCRIGTDITHGADPRRIRRRLPGPGRPGRPGAAGGRCRGCPTCVTATSFLKAFNDGRLRTWASAWWWWAAATPPSTWPPWRAAWATSTRSMSPTARARHRRPPAHDVAEASAARAPK